MSLCHAKSCTIQRVYCVSSASENTNCGILQHYHSNKSKVWNVCVSGKAERGFSDMYHHMTEELYRKYKRRKKNKNKHWKKKENIKKESKGTKWETRRRKNGGRETNSKSYPTLIFQKIKTVMNDKDVLYGNWKKKESDETFYK